MRSDREISKLDPNWITGFIDGEGSFTCSVVEDERLKTGWEVKSYFQIKLHERDKPVLVEIQKSLGVGKISNAGPDAVQWRVQSIKELEKVINHFDQYPLITKKRADFELFKRVFFLIENKEHITPSGLRKIVALKAAMNLGLSEKLQLAFHDVVAVPRPEVKTPLTIEPNWLAGFTSAEGSYIIKITKSKTHRVGSQVILVFVITQHMRDQQLLIRINKYFGCGNLYKNRQTFNYEVTKFSDIVNKIIPLFQKHRIRGVKALDFADFCDVAEMMKQKKHLTDDGLDLIRKIKLAKNRGYFYDLPAI